MTGNRLKSIIQENNVSLAELSRKLGVSPQSISQALSATDVKSGLIERISAALNVSIASIYGESTSVSNGLSNGIGVNPINNDIDVINRFLAIIEEKDKQIDKLLSMLQKD